MAVLWLILLISLLPKRTQACQPTYTAPMQDSKSAFEPIARMLSRTSTPSFDLFESRTTTFSPLEPEEPLYPEDELIINTEPSQGDFAYTSKTTTITTTTATTTADPDEKFTVKWTCSSAVVQVETIYPWDPAKTDFYFELLNNSLKQLEQHSGMTLSSLGEFRRKAAKTTTANQDVYGELFYIPQITKPCSVLKEFVRKAVSWSKDIPRVVLACRCETPVEIYKVNPPREGDKPSSSRNL